MITTTAAGSPVPGLIILAVFALLGCAMYLLPTLIASARHVPNVGTIAVVNIFLGWSFIGWVLALAWACKSVKPAQVQLVQAAPPLPAFPYPPHQ